MWSQDRELSVDADFQLPSVWYDQVLFTDTSPMAMPKSDGDEE
jgi:hypothetical protein